jgi:hypothetical protein
MIKGVVNIACALAAILIAPLVIIMWPFLCWAGAGGGLYHNWKRARFGGIGPGGECSVDADCPPGYICIQGRCVPEQAR